MSRSVIKLFVQMYNEGLIYKARRLVNWCPKQQTTISDLEIETREENGKFYYFNYPLKDGRAIEIATTRPETLYGDVAVAVNPDDPRYSHLIGKRVVLPLMRKSIPIIADPTVERDFGTGALKITPAHDPNDYEIGKRHNLQPVWVLDQDGKMVTDDRVHSDVRGLDRYEAENRQ